MDFLRKDNLGVDILLLILDNCDSFDLLKLKTTNKTFRSLVEKKKLKDRIKTLFPDRARLWIGALSQKEYEIENFKYLIDYHIDVKLDEYTVLAFGYLSNFTHVKFINRKYDLKDTTAREGDMMCDFFGWRFHFNTAAMMYRLEKMDEEFIEKTVESFEEFLRNVTGPYVFDVYTLHAEELFWFPSVYLDKGKKILKTVPRIKKVLKKLRRQRQFISFASETHPTLSGVGGAEQPI